MGKKFYSIWTDEIVVYRVEATSKKEALDKFNNLDEDFVKWKYDEILVCDVSEW